MIKNKIVKKETVINLSLTGEDIIELLAQTDIIPLEGNYYNIEVSFDIPGGGDYSNTTLNITEENSINVTFTTIFITKE